MLIKYPDTENEMLEIILYNGNSGGKEISQLDYPLERPFSSQRWNFFRQENNHAYVKGDVFYQGDCRNNVLISPYRNNRLVNVRNAFVFVGDSFIEVSPISDISNAINKGKRKLSNQEIDYHIPKAVFERENLIEKDPDYVTREMKRRYGVESKKISMIPSTSKMGGIYSIEGKDGHKYILKYRAKNKERAELVSIITGSVPDFFPRIYHRVDNLDYTFEMEDGWYGLESFFEGSSKEKNLDYFSLLGEHIDLLHQQLADFSQNNKNLERVLFSEEGYLRESSFVSIYLDLATKTPKHNFLLSELEKIIDKDFSSRIDSLPKFLIHRDLNQSNILWINEKPKIIDPESIMISTRIREFIPALVLGENRSRPQYIEGSLLKLINSYNKSGKNSLSHEEENILPTLLKYSLLRYYVVRTIRRNIKEEGYLNELEKDLINLRKTQNDN